MDKFEIIARAIGYHFWHCESDAEAIRCGWDVARVIMKDLDDFDPINLEEASRQINLDYDVG